jgi:uncharacterized protein (DUF1778 family)
MGAQQSTTVTETVTPAEARTAHIQARLPKPLRDAAQATARIQGLTFTRLADLAIDQYVERRDAAGPVARAPRVRTIFRVTPSTRAALEAAADACGVTLTDVLEAALTDYIEQATAPDPR